jgi:fructose-1,6-bisphosphatase/inositol monophosphatase family enzyme
MAVILYWHKCVGIFMEGEIKLLAQKIVENIYKKVRKAKVAEFYRFGCSIGVGAGGDVTKFIDKLAEDTAVAILKKSKLKINLLSEEAGFIDNGGKYTFVFDPIDGTRNAYRGIPFYAVSLAVGRSKMSDVEYAIVKNIPTGDTFSAEKGRGAFFNKKRIGVPEIPNKELLFSLALGKNYDDLTFSLAKKDKVRSLGAASLEMCMVAIGALDFYLVGKEYIRVVDVAASTLILREAGGFVKNICGQDLDLPFSLDERSSVVAACSEDLIKKIISK